MTKEPENTGQKQDGKFKPGQSGNPSGRPKGSRNKASLLVQTMLDGEAEEIAKKLLELAKQGDMQAIKMIIERLLPPIKELPLNSGTGFADDNIAESYNTIFADVAAGEITLGEAKELAAILESKRRAVETVEVKTKLDELKNLIAAGRS